LESDFVASCSNFVARVTPPLLSFKLFQAALEQVSNSLHHHTKLLVKKKEQLSTGVKNTSTGQSCIFTYYFGHTIRVSHEVNPTLAPTGKRHTSPACHWRRQDLFDILFAREDMYFVIIVFLFFKDGVKSSNEKDGDGQERRFIKLYS
jgi:hypothetical protein